MPSDYSSREIVMDRPSTRLSMIHNTPNRNKMTVTRTPTGTSQPLITKLPTEILARIFQLAISPANFSVVASVNNERARIILVCRRFQTIVESQANLWSFLTLSGPFPNFKRMDRALARTKVTALDWHLDLRVEDYEESHWLTAAILRDITDRVDPRMYRTRSLLILVDDLRIVETLYYHFEHIPAPMLRVFKLVRGTMPRSPIKNRPSTGEITSPNFIFNNQFPVLQTISIHVQPTTFYLFDLDHVTSLDLTIDRTFQPISLLKTLAAAPRLSSLTIRHADTCPGPFGSRLPNATLPHLKRLVLGGLSGPEISELLSHLEIPPIHELGIQYTIFQDGVKVWNALIKRSKSTQVFSELERLELLDVAEFSPIRATRTSLAKANPDNAQSDVEKAYLSFLSTLPKLSHIAMMRTTVGFLKALENTGHAKILPTLRILEFSMMAKMIMINHYDHPKRWPISEIKDILLQVLASRQTPDNTIFRVHLQHEEWSVSKEVMNLSKGMKNLGHPPTVCWDAEAPFFQDYYDVVPI